MTKPHRATLSPWSIGKKPFYDFPCVFGIVTEETDGTWCPGDEIHTSRIVKIEYDHVAMEGVLETKNSTYKLGTLVAN